MTPSSDHLAGEMAVALFDRWVSEGVLARSEDTVDVSASGHRFLADRGLDVAALARQRRVLCRSRLDWSQRKHHLAGALAAAVLDRVLAEKWARRDGDTRAILFSTKGRRLFTNWYR